MIIVFNSLPISSPAFGTFSVVNSRASTAAAEIVNEIEWLVTV